MEPFSPSDLKTILHSKRANLYYLEHCRILVKDGCVSYVTEQGKDSLYWNIPIANTTTLLLGTGTSITQDAMRELAKSGVMVGFCGGGGSPLFSGTDCEIDVEWLTPQSEYRPTQYLQQWVAFWFDDQKRFEAAQYLQLQRLAFINQFWQESKIIEGAGYYVNPMDLEDLITSSETQIQQAADTNQLLNIEARLTKKLFQLMAQAVKYGQFTREKGGQGIDPANRFLDHGNYLAYGLGATASWVLGLPHGLAILHGKTRRGGLVFDAADLIKDGLVLPQAFISAMRGDEDQTFRQACIQNFLKNSALDKIIESLQEISQAFGASS